MFDQAQQPLFEDAESSSTSLRTALAKAYRLLAHRGRSEKELREALARAGYAQTVIDEAIANCKQQRFIDDANFARQFIQYRLRNRPMGRQRLAVELRQKGINAEIIAAALDEFSAEETQLALADQLAEKQRKRLVNLPPPKARQRLADFLRRRGFDWETIQGTQLWKELLMDND